MSRELEGVAPKNTGVLLPTRSQLPSRVESAGEAAHVALGVGGAALAAPSEAQKASVFARLEHRALVYLVMCG